jgi:catechol-2,3-dioxygenase
LGQVLNEEKKNAGIVDAQRVDFIAVPTQDRERAAKFYEQTLGLQRNPNSTGAAFKDPDGRKP